MAGGGGNKEILLLCLRYLNINHKSGATVIEETFLDSSHIQDRPTGSFIRNHILTFFVDHGFNVKDCRGKACDGAAAMSSQTKGRGGEGGHQLLKSSSHFLQNGFIAEVTA